MARPSADIILQDNSTNKTYEILAMPELYYICYKNSPVKIRTRLQGLESIRTKYLRTSGIEHTTAVQTMQKLNEIFQCSDFTIKQLKD